MVTERSYKHALKVIKAYEEQQKNLKFEKFKELNITLDTPLIELAEHISTNLFHALHEPKFYIWHSKHQTLSYFTDINKETLFKYNNVGKKTVEEFITLMAIAGHTVL